MRQIGDKVFVFCAREGNGITFLETTVLSIAYSVSKARLKLVGYRVESLIAKNLTTKPQWTFATREEAIEAFTKELK